MSTRAQSAWARMLNWAARIRSETERLGLPKTPIPNVVVQTIVSAKINVAVTANTGWQRAAIQETAEIKLSMLPH